MANEQLSTSDSPTLVSEPSSSIHTENESSDGGSSDADDDKQSEQNACEHVQSSDENDDKQSEATEDEDTESDESDKDDASKSSVKNDDKDGNDADEADLVSATETAEKESEPKDESIDLDDIRYKKLKIMYQGRDILDFSANVANKSWHSVQYAHLPQKNYQMYINNRSQYNRLAVGYENPENYSLNTCARCAFHFPVLDLDKAEQPAAAASATAATNKTNVNELLTHTIASIISRDSPIESISALAQKLQAQSMMASPIHAPNAQAMNANNFMMNNNAGAAPSGPSYAYQNQNRNQFAGVNNNNSNNNHSCYKQNNIGNAFYGNNVSTLNALVNHLVGNGINNMNNSNAFNSNFINGTNNNSNLNQLSNAALANLMNPNRQQQQQQQQMYGMCRQNINKSGINFNANSHKPMPTYSHF